MNTHTITAGAIAFATIVSALVLFGATRRLIARGEPKFRFAAVVVWMGAAFGYLLAWFPGFSYGGYFGGAVFGAAAKTIGLSAVVPVAIGIGLGMAVATAALGAILPMLLSFLCFRPARS